MEPIDVLYDAKASKNDLRRALAEALGERVPVFEVTEVLFNRCRDAFVAEYERYTGLPYRFSARDGKALQSIIDQMRAILVGNRDDEAVLNGFCALVSNLPEWYRNNQFNLPVIDHKFNDIVRTIKNERHGNGKSNGIDDDYKRELLASLQATR